MNQRDILKIINTKLFKVISSCSDQNNVKCYLIGGFVRDLITGNKDPKDIDILIIGDGIYIAKKVCNILGLNDPTIYKRFGTAAFKFNDYDIEFVGSRKESYSKNSRNPVVEVGSFDDDLNRRDFTINTICVCLNSSNWGKIVDKFNGIEDIKNKIIKTPLDPTKTFCDDPLRMLRAIRFSCQLKFSIDSKALKSIYNEKKRIKIISGERIADELNKILMTNNPSKGFKILEQTGILSLIMPELTALKGIEEIEGFKHKDNFFHTLEVLDNTCKNSNNLWLRWAALLHDIGKASTKKLVKNIGWTFHGHELRGSKMVKKIFLRFNMPLNHKLKYVQKIIFLSSRPIVLSEDFVSDSAVRRLIYDSNDDIDDLLTLCEADITTKNPNRLKKYLNNFKKVRQKIIEVEERDKVRNFQPPIGGEEIMKYFHLKPCKEIGIIKEFIKNSILDGKIENNYKSARSLMIKKGIEMGLKKNR